MCYICCKSVLWAVRGQPLVNTRIILWAKSCIVQKCHSNQTQAKPLLVNSEFLEIINLLEVSHKALFSVTWNCICTWMKEQAATFKNTHDNEEWTWLWCLANVRDRERKGRRQRRRKRHTMSKPHSTHFQRFRQYVWARWNNTGSITLISWGTSTLCFVSVSAHRRGRAQLRTQWAAVAGRQSPVFNIQRWTILGLLRFVFPTLNSSVSHVTEKQWHSDLRSAEDLHWT